SDPSAGACRRCSKLLVSHNVDIQCELRRGSGLIKSSRTAKPTNSPMKKVLLLTASLVTRVGPFAHGTVQFNNAVAASGLQFRVYDFDPANPFVQKHGNS